LREFEQKKEQLEIAQSNLYTQWVKVGAAPQDIHQLMLTKWQVPTSKRLED